MIEQIKPEVNPDELLSSRELAEKYDQEVSEFFEIDKIAPELVEYMTVEELKEAYEGFYGTVAETLSTGFVSPGQTHILKKNVFPEGPMGEPPTENYRKVLKHETTHHYVNTLNEGVPYWLNEGTCLFVAEQEIPEPDQITLDDLIISDQNGDAIFVLGKAMVKRVIEEFGKEKLFELIKIEERDKLYTELKKMFKWLK